MSGHNTGTLFPELEEADVSTGVLPSQQIDYLISRKAIYAKTAIANDQVQPASIDLRLGRVAYRVRASFLPGENSSVTDKIQDMGMHKLDLTRPAVLEKGCVYIIPLIEELNLPRDIYGKANPKSTTGRLDIFTRLIADRGTEFESVPNGYRGELFVEVVPRTFSILVQEGIRLNQLRFIRSRSTPRNPTLDQMEPLAYREDDSPAGATSKNELQISIDLRGTGERNIIGYKAKSHAPLIDLSKVNHYEPLDFWDPILSDKRSIVLDPDDFYILVSKERIRIPPNVSASMVAYDPSVGEFRVHYAGFFDPGFGYGDNDILGTKAVLEVRSHEVPFLVEDGQVVGRLLYERLAAIPKKIYGADIGSSYQRQGLALSKQFKSV